MRKPALYILFAMLLPLLISGCGKTKGKTPKAKQYTVGLQTLSKSLYFTGTIQPLYESSITSPVNAVVQSMPVNYGQMVYKGDVIMTLSSSELQRQYYETLTDYLKAKDNYSIATAKFNGTEELWQAGLISKNNYLSEKSSLDTARISLIQATGKLTDMLAKVDDPSEHKLSSLTLSEYEKVKAALSAEHKLIKIKAAHQGILLYPPKASDDKSAKIRVGSSVKAGQVMALIGDLQGVKVEIDVPEIDIGKIHTGMPAKVKGIALGPHVLNGKLSAVNAQASTTGNNSLPSFSAVVEVEQLTPKQQSWVKVGMSASIELTAKTEKKLTVPIAAVYQDNGANVVHVKSKDGRFQSRTVLTGSTHAGNVIIESGLKQGDVVQYG